ncbi:monogalactosyldiacylglycerol synthase [Candidatus Omnitrophus magneticus]|uniref:Monogalactosyldiacylglycerol synthase n=1 Tax=Candidatus Omnitrophus magneticus TaxID=1609969 RepID=A0A0F0CR19_9BACT|nr:monogalactosyldiacylglycerol synthase [Candidatus Omnitrophus magneticus]
MNKKKIIILYSTGGMGHKKAAEAILEYFKQQNNPSLEIKTIDSIDFGGAFYKFTYGTLYIFLMTKAKLLWGFLYHLTNTKLFGAPLTKLARIIERIKLKKLIETLIKENPDIIISTHFILPSIAAALKSKKDFHAKLYTVITDYGPHRFWLSDYIDKYFIGYSVMARDMARYGVSENKLIVSGIPVMPNFYQDLDRIALKKKYNLTADEKTIFILSGGFGVGPIEKILKNLCRLKINFNVIVVAGHNEQLYKRLLNLSATLSYTIKIFGFTDKISELMGVSDLMITKAGGISISEAIARELPMILCASIPGQETWNENMLINRGAGKKSNKAENIAHIINQIFSSTEYDSLKNNIKKIAQNNAGKIIVEYIEKNLQDNII